MIRHLLALAAMCLAVPAAAAQTVSGCGPQASLNSTAKLASEATCFGKARNAAATAVTTRQVRLAAPAPPPPVKTPPMVITTPPVGTPAAPVAPKLQTGMNLSPVSPASAAHPFLDRMKYVQWRSDEWGDLPSATLV